MKECPNCHSKTEDQALSCPVCGTVLDAIGHIEQISHPPETEVYLPAPDYKQSQFSHTDRTKEFTGTDIAENKLPCMIVYLLGVVGVIIALLMSPASAYTRFHIRQSLKFMVLETLIILACVLFFWSMIVPVLGLIAIAVFFIARVCCFADVCRGKATESAFLQLFRFLN